MRSKLRDIGQKLTPVDDAITAHAKANAYHAPRDYLNSLVWDGQNHIARLADCMAGDHPIVTYASGAQCPLHSVYLHRWLIAAVAKVFEATQNAVLTFTGGQGVGKSSLAAWLCPPALRKKYFVQGVIDPHNKDHELRLMEKMIWEVGELDATTRRADVAALKEFVSREQIDVRRSYGRYATIGPAMASMIGTVNSQEFLADDTGNRRFYVIDLTDLDWSYTRLDIDQVWAEAVARWRRGESRRLTDEESAVQTTHNRQFLADGIIGDHIRKHFMVTGDPAHTMTAADIVDYLRNVKNVPLQGADRALSMDIARVMAALGVSKQRTGASRFYVGLMPK
jgi:putative DNA primase/helicase